MEPIDSIFYCWKHSPATRKFKDTQRFNFLHALHRRTKFIAEKIAIRIRYDSERLKKTWGMLWQLVQFIVRNKQLNVHASLWCRRVSLCSEKISNFSFFCRIWAWFLWFTTIMSSTVNRMSLTSLPVHAALENIPIESWASLEQFEKEEQKLLTMEKFWKIAAMCVTDDRGANLLWSFIIHSKNRFKGRHATKE